jgi:hypothetical protein
MAIVKKGMGKSVKKAQKGTKVPKYDDDANDRIMADTYADYMNDKKRGKIPLSKNIQDGIKNGTLNPDGTIKKPTKRGSESNTSRTPMKNGGKMKKAQSGYSMSNKFTVPQPAKDGSAESNKFKIPSKNKIVIPKKKAKSGGSFPDLNKDGKVTKADILKGRGVIAKKGAKVAKMAKCKYGCK